MIASSLSLPPTLHWSWLSHLSVTAVVLVLLVMDYGDHGGGDGRSWRMSVTISMWGMAGILILAVVWVLSIWLIPVVLILTAEQGHGAGFGGGESSIGILIGSRSGVKLAVWWARILLDFAGLAGLLVVAGLAISFLTGMDALGSWIMTRAFRGWEDGGDVLIDVLTMVVSMVLVVIVVVMATMFTRARELIVTASGDI